MDIQLYFVESKDSEMRDNATPVVVTFEEPPRPPHLATYQDLSESDAGGPNCIDGRMFNAIEHYRGATLWVWRITGGMGPKETLEGCWAEARIETYQEQCQRLEGCLAAERDISKGLETLIERAADVASLADRKKTPSRKDIAITGQALAHAVDHVNCGRRLYDVLTKRLGARVVDGRWTYVQRSKRP